MFLSTDTSHLSYAPFNFFKLDSKLNLQKIQQKKKQELQKKTLNVQQKQQANLQLAKYCDQVMASYKDHYNIKRRFSIFYADQDRQIVQNQQNREQNATKIPESIDSRQDPLKKFLQVKSKGRSSSKALIQSANNIMKPIKTNQYLDSKGTINIATDYIKKIYIQEPDKKLSQNPTSNINATTPSQFRVKSFSQSVNLAKKQQLMERKGINIKLTNNQSVIVRQRRNQLKRIFRKNIFIIIEKLKLMKVTYSDIVQKNVFESKPYKFGEEIFHAVKQGNEAKVFRILMQNRLTIFVRDTTNKTPLMWACIRGHDKIAELLLTNGMQPHSKDYNNKTAIELAVKYNHINCVKTMFLWSNYLQDKIQSSQMSSQMRKIVRIGISSQKYLMNIKNIQKKKQFFEQQYRYYFKD